MFNYVIMLMKPLLEGFFLGFIPVFLLLAVNSVFLLGYLLNSSYEVAGNQPTVNNGIFDALLTTYGNYPVVTGIEAQRARLGISLIAMGAYVQSIGTQLLIVNESEPSEEPKGNV